MATTEGATTLEEARGSQLIGVDLVADHVSKEQRRGFGLGKKRLNSQRPHTLHFHQVRCPLVRVSPRDL